MNDIYWVINTFSLTLSLPDQIFNSPFSQQYNSFNVSSENLVLDHLIIPILIFFFSLITYLVDIVFILLAEILSQSLVGVKGLNPRSDSQVTSHYNFHTLSSKQVMRKLKLIRKKLLSWSNSKFSYFIFKEMCRILRGELTIRSWELKG